MKIATIQELTWKPHLGGYHAEVKFENGYTASVLRGGRFYTDNGTYEIAVINSMGKIDYTTHITNDVLGYLSLSKANKALQDIAALPVLQ